MLKHFLTIFFALTLTCVIAQERKKPYFIRITMDKLRLGNDSANFKSPKTFYVESDAKSDTIEVGAVKGKPVAMTVEIQKFLVGKTVRYRFSYTFFEKKNARWTLIKKFGWVDRFSLLPKPDEVKNPKTKKAAREEYYCSIGEPMQFSASFRMDIYLNQ